MKLGRVRGCRHRMVGALAVAASGVAFCAPAAHATTLAAGSSCTPSPTTQAFSAWGDTNEYSLVPGGTFASAASSAGWTLTGGAKLLSVDVPFNLGDGSVGALYMPPGSTAQSPTICVDASDPTYRFVGIGTRAADGLTSQAVYTTLLGVQIPVTLSQMQLPASWGPVAAAYTGAAPVSVLSGGTARMSLRFTSSGDDVIDDVFVDPRMHGG